MATTATIVAWTVITIHASKITTMYIYISLLCRNILKRMNSKILILHIFLSLAVCLVIVMYPLYTAHKSHPYPVKKVALGAFQQMSPFSEPQEELSSLCKRTSSYTPDGTLPPLPETLPYPALIKRTPKIRKALWTSQLYQFFKSLNCSISPHVNMVLGDSKHIELVLNWIIAAHVRLDPPLHNIIVISIDQPLCDLLVLKEVPVTCITILPETFLASTGPESYQQGIKTRLLVLRLINFWGYDVASYDSDAVLLRNPQHFFDSNPDVQLFAGSVRVPWDVSNLWGFAICGGSVIVRSHHSTGMSSTTAHFPFSLLIMCLNQLQRGKLILSEYS